MELEFSGFPFPRLRAEALRRASTGMTTFYDVIKIFKHENARPPALSSGLSQ